MIGKSVVTPWKVEGTVDYIKLVKEFGTQLIDENLLRELKEIVGDLHLFFKRDYVFSHRDLDKVLEDYLSKKMFFLYTGIGPSGNMHIGHLLPFLFTKWLQEKFKVNLYIQVTDDEKFLFRKLKFDEVEKIADDDILNIAALGFDPDKTFIFKDTEFIGKIYNLVIKTARKINFSTVKAVFGFTNETNIGSILFPAIQIVPTFFEKRRCLIPSAIDQDPYWRIQRDIAESLGYYKTAAIHTKFLPGLLGPEGKMSASDPRSTIFLNDDPETVREKILKYAYSGGGATIEEHRKKGGNVNVDVCFQWLKIFLEPDDKKLKEIKEKYQSGEMLTGELKEITIKKLNEFLELHRKRKENAKKKLDKYKYDGKLAKEMWQKKF